MYCILVKTTLAGGLTTRPSPESLLADGLDIAADQCTCPKATGTGELPESCLVKARAEGLWCGARKGMVPRLPALAVAASCTWPGKAVPESLLAEGLA